MTRFVLALVSAMVLAVGVAPAGAALPGRNGALLVSAATREESKTCGGAAGPPQVVGRIADENCEYSERSPYAMYLAGPGRGLVRWQLQPSTVARPEGAGPGQGDGWLPGMFAAGGTQVLLSRQDALYVAPLRQGVRPISLGRRGSAPAGSADGRWIAYVRGEPWGPPGPPGGVYVAPASGGRARYVADGSGPRWSSRGQLAFNARGKDGRGFVAVTDARGDHVRRLARMPAGEGLSFQDWAPDGRELLVIRTWSDAGHVPERSALYAVGADGRRFRRLTPFSSSLQEGTGFYSAVWSPDGRKIAFEAADETADYPRSALYTVSARARFPQGPHAWRKLLVETDDLHDWQPLP